LEPKRGVRNAGGSLCLNERPLGRCHTKMCLKIMLPPYGERKHKRFAIRGFEVYIGKVLIHVIWRIVS
jgi:hypothetical protein